jgi:hypothetical protein
LLSWQISIAKYLNLILYSAYLQIMKADYN